MFTPPDDINDITPELIRRSGSESFQMVMHRFSMWLQLRRIHYKDVLGAGELPGVELVAHNAFGFDMVFLKAEILRCFHEAAWNQFFKEHGIAAVVDSLALLRQASTLRFPGFEKLSQFSLGSLAQEYAPSYAPVIRRALPSVDALCAVLDSVSERSGGFGMFYESLVEDDYVRRTPSAFQ